MSDLRRRRSVGHEGQLQVLDNSIDDGRVGEESDDAHLTATLRADHRVNLIDFSDHLGPAPGRDGPEFLPNNPEGKRPKACLPDLSPMGVGVQAEVTDSDLALVGNVRGHPGDKLQIRPQR